MTKKIDIPDDIYDALKERVEDSDFGSVEEYVRYILRQFFEGLKSKRVERSQEENFYTTEDEVRVKERLKALGYLD